MGISKLKVPPFFLVVLAVLVTVWSLPLKSASADSQGVQEVLPLAKLVAIDEIDQEDQINLKENQINLMTAANSFKFALPISKRMDLTKLILHLDFIHSISLLKNRSQVWVVVNGIVVSQIGFDPSNPHVIADIPIPFDTIREGYNKVEFKVAQHYSEECEDPAAPELWTQVNTIKSYFYLEYQYRQSRFTLASLDDVFDRKLNDYTVTVMRPKTVERYDDTDLLWGALAAQGVSLRLEYKSVTLKMATAVARTISGSDEQLTTSDNPLLALDQTGLQNDAILIGTRDELLPLVHPRLRGAMAEEISGPFLALYPASDPRFQIVVISGADPSEVGLAAQAFAFARSAFPDSPSMVVKELNVPPIDRGTFPMILQPGVVYPFKDLGFRSTTKVSHKRMELKFIAPPDLLTRKKADVTIKLDFAYGAAFREDSVLNIYLNGTFEKAIYLDNKLGARFHDYEFYIPASSILPGLNVLRFESVLPPLVTGKCTAVQHGNAMITIRESSSIELPLLDRYVKLPDFSRFHRTGYPFTNSADGAEMGIVVRGQNSGSILAAWQILAKLSQVNAMPLYKAALSFRAIEDRHLFIIGDRQSIYSDDMRNSPVQLGETFQFDYPIDKRSQEGASTIFNRVKVFFDPLRPDRPGTMNSVYAKMKFTSSLDRDTLLAGYQSAEYRDRLVMLLTSEKPDSLLAGVRRLVEPDFWDVMEDNLAIWNEDDFSLKTYRAEAEFFVGKTSLRNSLGYYYSVHRAQFLVIMSILVVLLAWLIHRLLNRYKNNRRQGVSEIEP